MLTQKTEYPSASTSQFDLALPRPETFAVFVRIPSWIGPKTSVSVNGRKFDNEVVPGKFLALQRTWKDGDRVELEFEMPLRLEAVDQRHPNNVALLHGPVALFAVGEIPSRITRKQLLAVSRVAESSEDWSTRTDRGTLTFRPFASIMSEDYRLYLRVES